jgi:hypothetical protein
MNFPFFSCNKCTNSEKDSLLLTKSSFINNKDDIIKENLILSSEENNNKSINDLEIIEYPYVYCNQEEAELYNINTNDRSDDNEFINVKDMLEKGLDHHIHYRNNNKNNNIINNSSSVINNEDSITQNKILLKNLYSNNDNNNAQISNNNEIKIDKKNNIIEGYESKKRLKNFKMQNNKKEKKRYENSKEKRNNNNNIIGIKVEYPCPDIDEYLNNNTKTNTNTNFKTNNNTYYNVKKATQVVKSEVHSKEKKVKQTKSNFNLNKISNLQLAKYRHNVLKRKNKTINNTNSKLSVKHSLNTSISKNLNTYSLYLDNNNNFLEELLFKNKMKKFDTIKNLCIKKINNLESTRLKKNSKIKKKKIDKRILDKRFSNILNKTDNNSKQLLNDTIKINNYTVRNTFLNYHDRKKRVSKCNLKRVKKKQDLSYSIRASSNPFELEEIKISKIVKRIKSKSKKNQK